MIVLPMSHDISKINEPTFLRTMSHQSFNQRTIKALPWATICCNWATKSLTKNYHISILKKKKNSAKELPFISHRTTTILLNEPSHPVSHHISIQCATTFLSIFHYTPLPRSHRISVNELQYLSMPYEFSHFYPTCNKMSTHLTPRYLQKISEITANEQLCEPPHLALLNESLSSRPSGRHVFTSATPYLYPIWATRTFLNKCS